MAAVKDTLFNTSNESFKGLLGVDFVYNVPEFQRDYSWTEENWEALWEDIERLEEDEYHYMGNLVLKPLDKKTFQIIDGQQRFTTLSLVVLATIKFLLQQDETEEIKETIKLLRERYLGLKKIGSLTYTSKLHLNENNDTFYQEKMLELKETEDFSSKESNKLLYQGLEYFYKKISEKFQDTILEAGIFLDTVVAENLLFIKIVAEDDANAYMIFETLNDRGVKLSTTDLLKNYLFSLVASDPADLKAIKQKWNNVISIVTDKDFATFLRYFMNSKQTLVRKDKLFKSVRNSITKETLFDLFDELIEYAKVYNAFNNENDSIWTNEQKEYIKILRMFDVDLYKLMILASTRHLEESDTTELLKYAVILTFRFRVVAKRSPSDMEKIYNRVAINISNGTYKKARNAKEELKAIYIDDGSFEKLFSSLDMSTKNSKTKKVARYILFEIENSMRQTQQDTKLDINDSSATIEHILPESPTEYWTDIFGKSINSYVYKLGNYCLLQDDQNRAIENFDYEEKKDTYQNSSFYTASDETIGVNKQKWNQKSIEARQAQLAKKAKMIWKINF